MKAAFLAFPDCAVWQVALLQKVLTNAGWAIRTLTLDGKSVRTDGGLQLCPDGKVETAAPRDYNLVLMAGGPVQEQIADNPHLHRFLRQYDGQRGLIASASESILYVAGAGLLGGLRFTTSATCYQTYDSYFYGCQYEGKGVCVDGNIVSCQPQANREFTSAVCNQLGIPADLD